MFADLEAGEDIGNKGNTGNKEREEEKKKEQEEYEKSVGYLTYLGQDTNELTGDKSWWQRIPEVGLFSISWYILNFEYVFGLIHTDR